MSRSVHFEIRADNLELARRFYHNAFGWNFSEGDGPEDYRFIADPTPDSGVPGYHGGLRYRRDNRHNYPATIRVPDLDAAVARITANGGTLAVSRKAIPNVGYLAYCRDPEGNLIGLFAADPTAG